MPVSHSSLRSSKRCTSNLHRSQPNPTHHCPHRSAIAHWCRLLVGQRVCRCTQWFLIESHSRRVPYIPAYFTARVHVQKYNICHYMSIKMKGYEEYGWHAGADPEAICKGGCAFLPILPKRQLDRESCIGQSLMSQFVEIAASSGHSGLATCMSVYAGKHLNRYLLTHELPYIRENKNSPRSSLS